MSDVRDLIIIGGGPAGYTAALYAARANLQAARDRGLQLGRPADDHERRRELPGLPRRGHGARDDGGVPPPGGALRHRVRHRRRDARRLLGAAVPRLGRGRGVPRATPSSSPPARARAGSASSRRSGCKGRGVSACATCDGAFFRDKHIVVVGGGDSAFEEALFLTRFGYKVTLVHRRDEFRASQIMIDRARDNEKIELKTPFVVEEVLGDGPISGVRLRNTETGETRGGRGRRRSSSRSATTRTRSSSSTSSTTTTNGYLVTQPGSTETNIPGVFAAGDVQDHVYRQAVTAAGIGLYGRPRRRAVPRGAGGPHRHGPHRAEARGRADRSASSARDSQLACRRAVLHLPELQGAVDRHRRQGGPLRRGRRLPPLRVRLPLRADGRLLPGADDRPRHLRPGGPHPRDRARRLRAERLERAGGARRGRRSPPSASKGSRRRRTRSSSRSSGACVA